MSKTWTEKNTDSLNEAIKSNEKEILRINEYMNSYFTSDAETTKLLSHIHALESENKKLEHTEPSKLSPKEIIALTKPNLPIFGHKKRKPGSLIRISFTDDAAESVSKVRHAVWKLGVHEWQYIRYE
ncbi:MAG: hypothetical protein ICV66_06715 [Chitinophagaceae bacterium]|nr:hypothetical protein [Chitinophagaceae bacterium]